METALEAPCRLIPRGLEDGRLLVVALRLIPWGG
ncbi:unnamed protein product [Rodentolepis nana]|uniref:Uncharacterized protein n=1 Tax=Rodentolepis nana TaxID=102285 RepID=A0A0R3TV81_RODNA|nr:unnamed protein product [Rodentolepis nana]